MLIGQVRHKVLFTYPSEQVKLIGSLFDLCNSLLLQLVEFLAPFNTKDGKIIQKYQELIPSISNLVDPEVYGLDADIVFSIGRPLIAAANEDMFGGRCGGNSNAMTDDVDDDEAGGELDTWNFKSDAMENATSKFLPEDTDVANVLSNVMYRTFWSLRSYDIYLPDARYHEEVARLKAKVEDLGSKRPKTKVIELERVSTELLIKKLTSEQKVQKEHVDLVKAKLEGLKKEFLSGLNAEVS